MGRARLPATVVVGYNPILNVPTCAVERDPDRILLVILSQGLVQRIADMELGVGSTDKAGQKRIYQQYSVM